MVEAVVKHHVLHAIVVPVVGATTLEAFQADGQPAQKESKVGVPGVNGGPGLKKRKKQRSKRKMWGWLRRFLF